MIDRRGVLAGLGLVLSPLRALADRATLSPGELAEQSDLIVLGHLLTQTDTDRATLARLVVLDVLKGQYGQDHLTLILPPRKRPMGLVASTDFQIPNDSRGLWYLKATDDPARFRLDRPDRYLPQAQAEAIIKALRAE